MWTIELHGAGAETLKQVEKPRPEPGPGQILVKLNAATLNYRDLAIVRGEYGKLRLPLVPLSDAAGEVVAIGDGVTRWQAGDRVIFSMHPFWLDGAPTREALSLSLGSVLDGVLTEYRLAGEREVVRTPAHLTDEQAASLPIAAVTAWTALVVNGGLRPGQWVVVQGTGGVSLFALQFAKHLGARVIVTSSSDEKLERARTLGADALVNYRTNPEWQEEVVRITGGEGADHIVDVGGSLTLDRSLDAIRPGGRISVVGFLSGNKVDFDLFKMIRRVAVLQ
ncbi:MAG TPA: NAD(P)-dependent alcohol dehydrogenase, partial [Thermoanaerobaculia bacterium]|nr:NAD(P)-dependent alcohol dehydrogenase [Thermoanaerobaculia bacterium]